MKRVAKLVLDSLIVVCLVAISPFVILIFSLTLLFIKNASTEESEAEKRNFRKLGR